MAEQSESSVGDGRRIDGDAGPSSPVGGAAEERLIGLMEEFERRRRRRPDLVVRPWWAPGEANDLAGRRSRGRRGFVVEYCPGGRESAELAVRRDRVTVEGPGGWDSATLDLDGGWYLDGRDRTCPETMVNYLLRMADGVLDGEAA